MDEIIAKHSHYEISNITEIPKKIYYGLSIWNPNTFKRNIIGFNYDKNKKVLRIPRGYPEQMLLDNCYGHHLLIDTDNYNKFDNININLVASPRDYIQKYTLTYMIGKAPYENTSGFSQKFVNLDTGEGKTMISLATMCYFKCKMIVFTPSSNGKISKQWFDSALKFTTLKKTDIIIVKGSKICEDILKDKYNNIKLFIMPRSTVLSFVSKYNSNWYIFEKLIKTMRAGIKIIDEAHMDFNTIVNIDNFTDVKYNYYLSSSPGRSNDEEDKIYKLIFSNVPKFGKELKSKEQNHIIIIIFEFKSSPTYKQVQSIKTKLGPSQALYGKYLLSDDGAREEFLEAYIFTIYYLFKFRKDNGKLLVLCITKEFAKELSKVTKEYYPQYSIGLYIGNGCKNENELNNDIIFATPKGMSTGSEIDNLQFGINTITYASKIMADQVPGRLRRFNNRASIYIELVNMAHLVAKNHYKKREKYLSKKAKNGQLHIHEICEDDISQMNRFFDKQYYYNGNGFIKDNNGHYIITK